jgi:crotonobetainyl-CoA:carnitine CoA-transferase CaiB-like acyl-CoA transferase
LIENFRPGMMAGLHLDYASVKNLNDRMIYCSLKGFLPGPYERRTALDEVVQMMGGLAYMTGLPGRPMRAGASVNDIMGAMFGVIAIRRRCASASGLGAAKRCRPRCSKNNAFLMAQAMLAEALPARNANPGR